MLMTCTDAIPSIQPSWLPGVSIFPFLPFPQQPALCNTSSTQWFEIGHRFSSYIANCSCDAATHMHRLRSYTLHVLVSLTFYHTAFPCHLAMSGGEPVGKNVASRTFLVTTILQSSFWVEQHSTGALSFTNVPVMTMIRRIHL